MSKPVNQTIETLMHRDNLTYEQARQQFETVRTMMTDCNFNPDECEEILADELGLELDYIFDFIW